MNLDCTCSKRSMWVDRENPDFIYMDVNPKVHPQIVGDLRRSPFRSGVFNTVWFDPPHLLRAGRIATMPKFRGHTWYGIDVDGKYLWSLFIEGSKEFKRILKPGGLLFLKWNEEDIPLDKALTMLVGWKVLMRIPYRSPLQRGKKQSWWVVLAFKP